MDLSALNIPKPLMDAEIPESLREALRPILEKLGEFQEFCAGLVEAAQQPEESDVAGDAAAVPVPIPRTPAPLPASEPDPLAGLAPDYDATRTALAFVYGARDTDAWQVGATENGVDLVVVTDVAYSTSTHVLSIRTRTVSVDPQGFIVAVAAEVETAVPVATAVECP